MLKDDYVLKLAHELGIHPDYDGRSLQFAREIERAVLAGVPLGFDELGLRGALPRIPDVTGGPQTNQCDGCNVAAPITERGNHAMPDGGFIGCTKDRYECGERQGMAAARVCDTCSDGDCLADNAGLPCPFSVSLRSIYEYDPQSFINGVKWARQRAASVPTLGDENTDDKAVDSFARAMKSKMAALSADNADMVWSDYDTETFHHSIDDAVEYEVQQAWPTEGPLELKVQLAKRIPTAVIRIFNITENGHEWVIVRDEVQ